MEQNSYEDLLRRLTGFVSRLDMHYEKLTELLTEQKEFNEKQVRINADVSTTLGCLKMPFRGYFGSVPQLP
jgi:flagellar biosynthesis chaperone FliJ